MRAIGQVPSATDATHFTNYLPTLLILYFIFYFLYKRLNRLYGCLSPADGYGDRVHESMIKNTCPSFMYGSGIDNVVLLVGSANSVPFGEKEKENDLFFNTSPCIMTSVSRMFLCGLEGGKFP